MAQRKDFEHRLKLVQELEQMHINLYPSKLENSTTIEKIVANPELFMDHTEKISGRIFALRFHGKVAFGDLVDNGFKIQLYLKSEVLKEKFEFFNKYLDRGDFVWCEGTITRTQRGELSILVLNFEILAKSLYDLPHQWFGLEDVETRYRARYLDLLLNKNVFEIFLKRSKIIREIRNYLDQRGYIEFETPVLQPIYGGANARPFITMVNSIKQNYYLRISDELYLKRLLVGGYTKVYEIAKDFRNEDIDTTHNPEFTMIEIYEAYKDYNDMMDLAEQMLKSVALKVNGSYMIDFKDHQLDLSKPWRRVTMYSLLREKGIDPKTISDEELQKLVLQHGIKLVKYSRGLAITKLFEELCEEELIEPTFVIDYPKESTPLCKIHRNDPELIERFEFFVNGMELANGYSELNDPIRQEQTLKEETAMRTLGDEEAQQFDEDFIDSLRVGMPNAGGIGIGIDRLVMLLTAQTSLKEVLLYPILAIKKEE